MRCCGGTVGRRGCRPCSSCYAQADGGITAWCVLQRGRRPAAKSAGMQWPAGIPQEPRSAHSAGGGATNCAARLAQCRASFTDKLGTSSYPPSNGGSLRALAAPLARFPASARRAASWIRAMHCSGQSSDSGCRPRTRRPPHSELPPMPPVPAAADAAACCLPHPPPRSPACQVRAAELLRAAEVIIYDDLGAAAAVEAYASSSAQRVYVGKRGGRPSITQPEVGGASECLAYPCYPF